jgi:dTDP-4-dehydrorhamnose reductase
VCERIKPDRVINAAAFHNVAQCEELPERAFALNATAVRDLAHACHQISARLVHVSTDYVFDGANRTLPYVETDLPAPLNVYGASKLAGEHLLAATCPDHAIVRTAALYGSAPCRGKGGINFVQRMIQLSAERDEIEVVNDEVTTPTWTLPLARQIRSISEHDGTGVYHASSQGACSWYEFACEIFALTGKTTKVIPVSSTRFAANVRRPNWSVLDNARLCAEGVNLMPHWREALAQYLQ